MASFTDTLRHAIRIGLAVIFLFTITLSEFNISPALPARAADAVYYVNASAQGANNGSSWEDAFTGLQPALTAASSGDQIWIATGVYYPTQLNDPGDTRSAVFPLKDGVEIYGGFAGEESDLSQRDWLANVVTLSGDLGTAGNPDDNAYHVVAGLGTTNASLLDGVTISGGNANYTSTNYTDPRGWGGGMINVGGSPTLRNVTFKNNAAYLGGGLANFNRSYPVLENVSFSENQAHFGGGVYNDASGPTMTGGTLANNQVSNSGGAMYSYTGSRAVLENIDIRENQAVASGGGIFNYASVITMTTVTFISNTATADVGGGIYLGAKMITHQGNADSVQDGIESQAALENVTFQGNRARYGGGVSSYNSSIRMKDASFYSNHADSCGGGMYGSRDFFGRGYITMDNVLFEGNDAAEFGGGLYDEGGSVYATNKHLVFKNNRAPGNSGGGVVTSISYATYSDVEISGNQAGRGGGLYVMGGAPRFISSTIISNSASVYGGGIALIVNSCPPDGFCNLFIISDTLVAHNTAIEGGGMYSKDSKAYIYDTAIVENTANKGGGLIMETANALAPIYMMNSTVSGNQATDAGGDGGGGILVKWGALNLWHVTVADNSSAATTGDNGAGGISAMTDAQVVLTNTLVAQNTSALGRPDLSGNFISTGGNLVGATDGSSGITDGVKGDRAGSLAQPLNPLLAALGSGSAASAVHALLPGSPAIDLGISENCRHFDQRQVARPQGADCDAGAYESRRFTAGQWGGGGQSTATGSLFPNPLTLVISSPFGEPVTGGVLRFTAPASGASLSAPTLDVVIGASGAVSQAVRANSVAGNYTVAVSANGLDNVSDSFALTNTPGGTTQYLYLPVIQRR